MTITRIKMGFKFRGKVAMHVYLQGGIKGQYIDLPTSPANFFSFNVTEALVMFPRVLG
jgi:hypothetical protein